MPHTYYQMHARVIHPFSSHPFRNVIYSDVHMCTIYEVTMSFDLPPARSLRGLDDQGWRVATTLKTSQVAEGAGNGRFSDSYIPAGEKVIIKKLIPMAEVSKLSSLAGDMTVTFTSEDEMERFITQAGEEVTCMP